MTYIIENLTQRRKARLSAKSPSDALARMRWFLPRWRGDDLIKLICPSGLVIYGRADMTVGANRIDLEA